MVLTLSLPVFAEGEAYLGQGTLAEGVINYEDLTIEEAIQFNKEVSLYRLPVEGETRYFRQGTPFTYGLDGLVSWSTTKDVTYGISPAAGDTTYSRYPLESNTNPVTSGSYFIQAPANTAYIFTAEVNYPADEYDTLTVGGNILSYVYCAASYGATNYGRIFPDKVQVLVNGTRVGEEFTHGSTGATINYEQDITEDITSIGFRFSFSQAVYGSSGGSYYPSNIGCYLYVGDDSTWEIATPPQEDPNTGFLQSILQWIIGIYNSVFVPDSQKDDADAFQSEVSGTVTEADNVKTELDDLEKPEPEEIDTDLSGIISDETYTQQTQIFVDLLKFEKITNMLMIVFTMALISYVLFGKKG